MHHNDVFNQAIWIQAKETDIFPVIRTNFRIDTIPTKATLTILGLGTYRFYVNGQLTTEDLFQPLSTNFEDRNFPEGEEMATRAYVNQYDVTDYLQAGPNTVATLLGNGWYDGVPYEQPFGTRKLCLSLQLTYADGTAETVGTGIQDRYQPSFIRNSALQTGEDQDYTAWDDACLRPDFDDSGWPHVIAAKPLETDYEYSDCPRDKAVAAIQPKVLSQQGTKTVYDVGCNLSGIPVIETTGAAGTVHVTVSEEILPDGTPDPLYGYDQHLTARVPAGKRTVQLHMTWLGFRYLTVEGPVARVTVLRTHADVAVTSSFYSQNSTLNWIYQTYLNTQRCNLHHGMPSDCPHLERRGYTGDGQLTCKSAMYTLDMQPFYEKWIEDIADCQDRLTGHVQYTAPYTHSGGGPGGWGIAIVELPYQMWKHYGDHRYLARLYPQMLRYFDYLEAHSEHLLVSSDRPGEWCLGEWCTPGPVILPAPFVNNYFYVKAMEKVTEIAKFLGEMDMIPTLEQRIQARKHALEVAYMNPWDGNFIGGKQGANAFALDIGLGDERTKNNLIQYYRELGYLDTGIFGTDIVIRKMFEYNEAGLAIRLLTAAEPHGFGKWYHDGATTFWEYWFDARSHNHPMFGAVTTYLFEYVLGIRQTADSYGFDSITVQPADLPELGAVTGHFTTAKGEIRVAITYDAAGKMQVQVSAPEKCRVMTF